MKQKLIFIALAAVILLASCAGQPGIPPETYPREGDELFSQAEKLFASKSYNEAAILFKDYVSRYPDSPLAPAALMKSGIISALAGDYEDARAFFRTLLSEYPESSYVPDALVEELFTYYRQERYEEVLTLAPDLLQRLASTPHIFKAYTLIGDTYLAMENPIDAVYNYSSARNYATVSEDKIATDRIREAIARLDPGDIALLVNHPDENLPMNYLLYQLGLDYALEEKYDEALAVLNEFLVSYPDSENRNLVDSLIAEIKKNAVFNRYTIGCLLPLSGSYEIFGNRALQGIELALSRFSLQANSPQINIIVKDTGADPDKTMAALEELYLEGVAAILGPIVTSDIAGREAQQMGIPIITFTQKDNIAEIGDKVFRNFITPHMQVRAIVDYTVNVLGLDRFAILYPEETYGDTYMNLFWDQLLESGASVVGAESYKPDQTDFMDDIRKLVGIYYEIPEDLKPEQNPDLALPDQKQTDADEEENGSDAKKDEEPQPIVDFDAVFIPDAPGKVGQIVPQLAYFDIKDAQLLGTNLWHSDSLIKIAQQYVQGAVMPDGFFAQSSEPRVREFVKAFEETYQETPDFVAAVVYDSAMIVFDVVSRPQIRYRTDIRDELLNLKNFPGVTGNTGFDENGDVVKKLSLLQIRGKSFVELK